VAGNVLSEAPIAISFCQVWSSQRELSNRIACFCTFRCFNLAAKFPRFLGSKPPEIHAARIFISGDTNGIRCDPEAVSGGGCRLSIGEQRTSIAVSGSLWLLDSIFANGVARDPSLIANWSVRRNYFDAEHKGSLIN